MWNSYFFELQKKYNMRLSTKMPLVIRYDGKGVTRNKTINLLDKYEGSFSDALEKTVQYFSKQYHCYAIFGSDEVSFIFTNNLNKIFKDLGADNSNYSNEIIGLFSQYFFDYFNKFNKNRKIFWHGKCFSIPEGKLTSYIVYRSRIIENVMTTYFLNRRGIRVNNMTIEERENKCKEWKDYGLLKDMQKGTLYFNGEKLDLQEFIKGNMRKVEQQQDIYVDLLDF